MTYWLFSFLYYHLRISSKKGSSTIEYGINYNISLVLFIGPFGLLLFETVYRVAVYFYKKATKTEEPLEGTQALFNIGSFVIQGSAAYCFFQWFDSSVHEHVFLFWMLLVALMIVTAILSDAFLIIVFRCLGDMKTKKDIISFLRSRSSLDLGKTALSNGLLFLFLHEDNWTAIIGLFILNYLVSQSYLIKAQNAQDKNERDKYERMAYTDFLTGVHNRAFMDAKLQEWKDSDEPLGIVVTDIDTFKSINDTYNHHVGDRVIQHYAETLKRRLSQKDVLIRSGGEEFILFLRHRTFEECRLFVQSLRQEVENLTVQAEFGDRMVGVGYTASFGLYYSKDRNTVSLEKGCVMADQLLLQAKKQGRNRVIASQGD